MTTLLYPADRIRITDCECRSCLYGNNEHPRTGVIVADGVPTWSNDGRRNLAPKALRALTEGRQTFTLEGHGDGWVITNLSQRDDGMWAAHIEQDTE